MPVLQFPPIKQQTVDAQEEKENNDFMAVTNELLDAKLKATESSFETRFVSIESQINLSTEKVLNEIHEGVLNFV